MFTKLNIHSLQANVLSSSIVSANFVYTPVDTTLCRGVVENRISGKGRFVLDAQWFVNQKLHVYKLQEELH